MHRVGHLWLPERRDVRAVFEEGATSVELQGCVEGSTMVDVRGGTGDFCDAQPPRGDLHIEEQRLPCSTECLGKGIDAPKVQKAGALAKT